MTDWNSLSSSGQALPIDILFVMFGVARSKECRTRDAMFLSGNHYLLRILPMSWRVMTHGQDAHATGH